MEQRQLGAAAVAVMCRAADAKHHQTLPQHPWERHSNMLSTYVLYAVMHAIDTMSRALSGMLSKYGNQKTPLSFWVAPVWHPQSLAGGRCSFA